MKKLLSAPLSSRKLVEYLLLFLLLALVLSLAAYGGCWYGKKQSVSPPQAAAPKAEEPSPPKSEDGTVGWKAYKNDEYLFEVKYPESWKVSETVNEEDVSKGITNITVKASDPKKSGRVFSTYVSNVGANESLDNLYIALSKFMVEDSLEDTKVGGVGAKKVLLYSGEVGIFTKISVDYIFNHNNLRWQLSFPAREDGYHEAVFDQILSTFRFLDQE